MRFILETWRCINQWCLQWPWKCIHVVLGCLRLHLYIGCIIWGNKEFVFVIGWSSTVYKPKFMGRPPDHPWWLENWVAKIISWLPKLFWLIFWRNLFLFINTKFACFLFNHVPTYRELGRPSVNFRVHVGSPDQVMVAFGNWATASPQHWWPDGI